MENFTFNIVLNIVHKLMADLSCQWRVFMFVVWPFLDYHLVKFKSSLHCTQLFTMFVTLYSLFSLLIIHYFVMHSPTVNSMFNILHYIFSVIYNDRIYSFNILHYLLCLLPLNVKHKYVHYGGKCHLNPCPPALFITYSVCFPHINYRLGPNKVCFQVTITCL